MWVSTYEALWRDEQAQDLLEYSLLIGFIALVGAAALAAAENDFLSIWNGAVNAMSDAVAGAG